MSATTTAPVVHLAVQDGRDLHVLFLRLAVPGRMALCGQLVRVIDADGDCLIAAPVFASIAAVRADLDALGVEWRPGVPQRYGSNSYRESLPVYDNPFAGAKP